MVEVFTNPDAEAEYEEAFEWYYDRSVQAADRFELAFDQAIQSIAESPTRWPLIDAIHRFRLLKRYPYSIIYRFDGDFVRIVAIAHSKRLPGYWRGRT